VRHAYTIAAILSIGFALLIGKMLQSPIPVITAAVLSAIFIVLYERALSGKV